METYMIVSLIKAKYAAISKLKYSQNVILKFYQTFATIIRVILNFTIPGNSLFGVVSCVCCDGWTTFARRILFEEKETKTAKSRC